MIMRKLESRSRYWPLTLRKYLWSFHKLLDDCSVTIIAYSSRNLHTQPDLHIEISLPVTTSNQTKHVKRETVRSFDKIKQSSKHLMMPGGTSTYPARTRRTRRGKHSKIQVQKSYKRKRRKRQLTLELGSGVSVTWISAGSLSATTSSAVAGAPDATKRVEFAPRDGYWGRENWREQWANGFLMGLRKNTLRYEREDGRGENEEGLNRKNVWAAEEAQVSIVGLSKSLELCVWDR